MNLLGIHFNLLIGPTVPAPAPHSLMEALQGIEVTHNDSKQSGFKLTFRGGRAGAKGLVDEPLLRSPLLKNFNRVVMTVIFNGVPRVLFDGVITMQQLAPGENGDSLVEVIGEDVSRMMDQHEKEVAHIAQPEIAIVAKLILSYAQYGLIPNVVIPSSFEVPNPVDKVPVQRGTDLQYLKLLAARFGHVFYVSAGPVPGSNIAYWGPPDISSPPQPALTTNMGHQSNCTLNFQFDANAPVKVVGKIQDPQTNSAMPVQSTPSARQPMSAEKPEPRTELARGGAGASATGARAQAQGRAEATSNAVTAQGELDSLAYGNILMARGKVAVRGAGNTYDGDYYVQSVTHKIRVGSYKQSFTLKRQGTGALVARVAA